MLILMRFERMVAALGVEPRLRAYKDPILPLNDAARKYGREGVNRTLVVRSKSSRPAIERPREIWSSRRDSNAHHPITVHQFRRLD
jgi:hypothetical protein